MLAAVIMLLGYAVIAVPTGIVTVEMARASRRNESTQVCRNCSKEGHEEGAMYCSICGHPL
jgi:voltage-gated potassium channel